MSNSIGALDDQGMSMQFDRFAQMAANAAKGSNVIRFVVYEASQRAINQRGVWSSDMFSTSGASIQGCRRAAKSGKLLPTALGMTDITADIAAASGFSDAGRDEFISSKLRNSV